jgi:hypothetical protein
MPRIKDTNGREHDITQDTIDRLYRAAHPEAASRQPRTRGVAVTVLVDGKEQKITLSDTVIRAAAAALDGQAGTQTATRTATTMHRPAAPIADDIDDDVLDDTIDARDVGDDAIRLRDEQVAQIARAETGGDMREAMRRWQVRNPGGYQKVREAFAGHRLPPVRQKRNHHLYID